MRALPSFVNGPVRVPLTKDGNQCGVPDGTKLDDEQQKALKEDKLYVNVHNPGGGGLRAQLH